MRIFTLILVASLSLSFLAPQAIAQGTGIDRAQMTCVPVEQPAQNRTILECRMSSPELPYFTVAEFSFPFRVTQVSKVSSAYSATLGLPYPAGVVSGDGPNQSTVMFTALSWGNANTQAQLQPVPLHTMSFLIETDDSMGDVYQSFAANQINLALLSPNPSDPADPLYQELPVNTHVRFDGTLILEAFTEYVSPSVLQFLQLGIACYEESPANCLANLIDRLE